jgi:hypothetical protein
MFHISLLRGKDLEVDRFAGDIELLLNVYKEGDGNGNILSFPIVFEHKVGSKVKSETIVEMIVDTWKVVNRFKKQKRKVYE